MRQGVQFRLVIILGDFVASIVFHRATTNYPWVSEEESLTFNIQYFLFPIKSIKSGKQRMQPRNFELQRQTTQGTKFISERSLAEIEGGDESEKRLLLVSEAQVGTSQRRPLENFPLL